MLMSNVSTILCALMLSSIAVGLPGPQPKNTEPQIIYIDPEIHSLSDADLALLNRTEGFFTPSRKIVPIDISGNVAVRFNNTGTLQSQRAGRREFTAYRGFDCQIRNWEFNYIDFGCGGFCATWRNEVLSMRLQQERVGSPYPTANIFNTADCSGASQKIGVIGTDSCTNSNRGGLRSAYLYWNC